MSDSTSESYILLETIHDNLTEGSIVEKVSNSIDIDHKVILGVGFSSVNVINESGDVFCLSGPHRQIMSILEPLNSNKKETNQTVIPEQVRGEPGDDGAPGKQGERGELGPVGPQGVPGEIGPQGIKGDRGDPGKDGPSGSDGVSGVGIKFVDNLDETTMLVHLTDRSVFNVNLPRGPSGRDGTPGIRGETGPVGERGVAGDPGEVGKTGEQGVAGPQGERGDKGAKGDKGEKGDKGDPGRNGKDGLNGEDGKVGPRGPRGRDGVNGKDGADGKMGQRGPRGKEGSSGKDGESGVVTARFPLRYDDKKGELSFDAKSLEKVLSVTNVDPMAINNLMTAIGGGGAVSIAHENKVLIKSVSHINMKRGLDVVRRGKDVNVTVDTDIPFSFVGTTLEGQKNESEVGTGDFWFNEEVGRLFFRIDANWVEV